MKKVLITLFCAVVFGAACASAETEHEFTGAKKCSLCHKKAEDGQQYQIWLDSKHAKAFETLGTPEAKAQAAKLGIDDPQKSGKCLKCHSTAYGLTEAAVSETIAVEEGVSCESCHGAGKDYAKKSIMENVEEAKAAGMVVPNEATCANCHNDQGPNPKPFDHKEYWEKIKHPKPE